MERPGLRGGVRDFRRGCTDLDPQCVRFASLIDRCGDIQGERVLRHAFPQRDRDTLSGLNEATPHFGGKNQRDRRAGLGVGNRQRPADAVGALTGGGDGIDRRALAWLVAGSSSRDGLVNSVGDNSIAVAGTAPTGVAGITGGRLDDRGLDDRGLDDRRLDDRGLDDRGLDDRRLDDRRLDDRRLDDRGLDDRGLDDRGLDDRGLDDRGLDDRRLDDLVCDDRMLARLRRCAWLSLAVIAVLCKARHDDGARESKGQHKRG